MTKEIEIYAAIGLLLLVFGAGFYFGRLGPELKLEKALASISAAEAKDSVNQQKIDQLAEEKKNAELQGLPPPVAYPVYLVRSATCAVPVPAKATDTNTAGGSAKPGPGRDSQPVNIRPQIEAFKLKWETTLADCREVLAKWPQ